jgi:hypothetical protein
MNFSIAAIMSRLIAPRHELSCPWLVWRRLVRGLRERGRGRTRESGAFLLGRRHGPRARVVDFVLYDDLDPRCLDTGIVRFDGRHMGTLWEVCERRALVVVADVHVHPGSEHQSDSDRAFPMVSRAGHIALILPRFADPPAKREHVGMYRYLGSKRWAVVSPASRREFLHIGV